MSSFAHMIKETRGRKTNIDISMSVGQQRKFDVSRANAVRIALFRLSKKTLPKPVYRTWTDDEFLWVVRIN